MPRQHKAQKHEPTAEMLDWADRGEQSVSLLLLRRFISKAQARLIRNRIRTLTAGPPYDP